MSKQFKSVSLFITTSPSSINESAPSASSSSTGWAEFHNIALPNYQGLTNTQICRHGTSLGSDAWNKIPALCSCHFYISGGKSFWQSAPDAKLQALDIFVTSRDTQERAAGIPRCPNLINFSPSRQEQIQAVCFCVSTGTFIQTSWRVRWCFSTMQWTLEQVLLKNLSGE